MRILLIFLFLQLHPLISPGQYRPAIKLSKDSVRSITKASLVNDLDDYANELRRHHISPFTHIRKRDFFDRIEKIKNDTAHYDADQVLIQLLQLNAEIQDEHTGIAYITRDRFPFYCYSFAEGIYVTWTDPESRHLLLSKIIAVNSIPIQDVIQRIATLEPTPTEAARKEAVRKFLFDPFVIHGLQIAPSRTDVSYTLISTGNDTITIRPKAGDRRDHLLVSRSDTFSFKAAKKNENWFKYVDSNKYIYFHYSTCYDEPGNHVSDLIKKLIDTIETKKPEKIVIDMIDNDGGYPHLLSSFITYLTSSQLNKKGRIYVLIGRRTFSAGIVNSVSLRNHTRAILVGEETSGEVDFFAGVEYFTLPETKLKVSYSTGYWRTGERYEGSLRPDVLVPETFADYSKNVNAALQYALAQPVRSQKGNKEDTKENAPAIKSKNIVR